MIENEMKEQNLNIILKVKTAREGRGWTQSHLAEATGLSERTIQRLESEGKASKETLLAIASVLEIDIHELTPEKVITPPSPEAKVTLLPLIKNGKQALDIVWKADIFDSDHPHVTGEDGQTVGALLDIIRDYGELSSDSDISRKIEWAETIDELLRDLTKRNYLAFGFARKVTISVPNYPKKTPMTVASIFITPKDSSHIIREGEDCVLAVIFPPQQSIRF